MKFSVNWLREFVDLPEIHALADLLTIRASRSRRSKSAAGNFEKIVVAQITKSKQHPNADRLRV